MKKKSLLLFYFLPIITAFAFTIANINIKAVSFQPKKTAVVESKKIIYNLPKTVSCIVANMDTNATPENWSNPLTWAPGAIPVAGSTVIIPANKHIILDVNPPSLAGLEINGTLEFAPQNLNLTAQYIVVMGTLKIGSPTIPFAQKAVITLNGANMTQDIMGMGTRGIMVMGGKLELFGSPPATAVTKLSDHATAGATSLNLVNPVNWNVNDQIVVATTDYYGAANGSAQRTQITAVNNTTSVNIQNGLNAQRWGKLQYLTASGMSLTAGTPPANLSPGTPTILDERAEVVNLTRNIVIQAPDDAVWQNNGFGCHVMIMRNLANVQGVARVNGVEIRRGGQAGKLARYPFHWHMLSYSGSTILPDVTGQYIRNSVVNQSAQRGIVIHGTNGAEVKNNIIYEVRGHGLFTEDASERRNVIDGNLVFRVRAPLSGTAMKVHESDSPSGFWISNPDNIIINNTAADCEGFGFWLAFPARTFGQSSLITLNPSLMKFGTFTNNNAHSNQGEGIFLDVSENDDLGNTGGRTYTSTSNMQEPEWPFDTVLTYELTDYSIWKNNTSGIWNRSRAVRNRRAVAADNTSFFFSGASNTERQGEIEKSLVVGTSLNHNMNGVTMPPTWNASPRSAFASYHSTFNIKDNVVVNFPGVANSPSGAFGLNDYYLIPVDKGIVRNTNNILINSHPGVRTMPVLPSFAFAALWDPHDYWGGSPTQDNYYVFNTPFFTHGQTPTVVAPSPAISGGVIVTGPFYGVANFIVNKANSPYSPMMHLDIKRLNSSLAVVGNWVVTEGTPGGLLQNMRHFATHPSGIYDLDFPTINNVNDISIEISNMLTTNDYQVIGMEYNGNYLINGLFSSTAYNYMEFGSTVPLPASNSETKIYQPVANLAAVISAPTGQVYWQDRINNKVWFKVRGGVNAGDSNLPVTHDNNLYKGFRMRTYGTFSPLSLNLNDLISKGITVYPNPSSLTEVSVKWNNENDTNDDVTVANVLGKIIFQKKSSQLLGEHNLKIDITNWSSGLYFIKVGNETVKFIKN